MAETEATIHVEVAFAEPEHQTLLALDVPPGTTAEQAIARSGIVEDHPQIDPAKNRLGIFSRLIKPDQVLTDGDRVEIYRPLKIDPREARRQLAEKKKEKKASRQASGPLRSMRSTTSPSK